MSKMRVVLRADIRSLDEDTCEIIMSTAAQARDSHVLLPQGCILDNYRANPIQLWQHDPDHPVGTNENIVVSADKITSVVRFAPLGISVKADEVRGLVKAGVIRAVSVSFEPIDYEPLDPKKPRGGQLIKTWEMLECSFVSVPSDVKALVTARQLSEETMTAKDRAAALEQHRRELRLNAVNPKFRGLYEVAELAYYLQQLGYVKCAADWEKEIEGDESMVPEMLGEACIALGEALVAMTTEEVNELMSNIDATIDVADGEGVERAATARGKAWRRGLEKPATRTKQDTMDELGRACRSALATHEEGMTHHRSAMRSHKRAMAELEGAMGRAGIDTDNKEIQNSEGEGESAGSANDRDFRARDLDILEMTQH